MPLSLAHHNKGSAKRAATLKSGVAEQYVYRPPTKIVRLELRALLAKLGRPVTSERQFDLLRPSGGRESYVYLAGKQELLTRPAVSIVGTREVSDAGYQRAARLGRELAQVGVVVMSGLARGVDTAALEGAIDARGDTVAVIGTPLGKAYPAENAPLQEHIYAEHLLVSPFADGEAVFKSNFPKRNRVMALLSDATVIVEASDTSGTLHQAAECLRQGRWLFIMRSVVEDTSLSWPKKFLGKPKVGVLTDTSDIVSVVT